MSFPYPTQSTQLNFGAVTVSLHYITDLDALFEELIVKGEKHADYQDERIPYWADLWHSAIAMSHFLVKSDLIKPGLAVTEIGCGLGLPGIVAGKLGADVLMTDYVPEPLAFLHKNWESNCQQALKTAILDWRQPEVQFSAPLILASDVAYEVRSFKALLHTIDIMLPSDGHFILAEPGRAMAQPFLQQLMDTPAYDVKQYSEEVKWDGFAKRIYIYDIHRKV